MLRYPQARFCSAKVAPHPSGPNLVFDPKWHSYKFAGKRLVSVSAVLNRYFPFDADKVAAVVAEKQMKTVEEVKAEWKKSAVLGSNVHARIEAMLLHESMKPTQQLHGDEQSYYPVADIAANSIAAQYEVVGVEAMLCSPSLRVAGTVDLIAKNRKTNALAILDWKTTAAALGGFRFSAWDTSCPLSLSHLQNQKMTRYALQILMYGFIFKNEGYEKLYGGKGIDFDKPYEYGLIQIGKDDADLAAKAEYHRVLPEWILPPDNTGEMSVNTVILNTIKS